jgi:hypothetical protein
MAMNEFREDITRLIAQAAQPESVEDATANLQPLLEKQESIPVLFDLLGSGDASLRKAAVTYLYQTVTRLWNELSLEMRFQIEEWLLDGISVNIDMPRNELVDRVKLIRQVYKLDENGWFPVIAFAFENFESAPFCSALILSEIVQFFDGEFYTNHAAQFYTITTTSLLSKDIDMKVIGLSLFTEMLTHIERIEDIPDSVSSINDLAKCGSTISQGLFTKIWVAIGDIFGSGRISASDLSPLIESAFQIAEQQDLESGRRILPVTALVNGISDYPQQLQNVLNLVISVMAQYVQEIECLPLDHLDLAERLLSALPEPESYSIFVNAINSAISSQNDEVIVAGLMLIQVVLVSASESAHRDAASMVELIGKVLTSERALLCQAAASVIECVFALPSLNVYSVSLLEKVIPLLTNTCSEVKQHGYRAAFVLCNQIDCSVPGIFKTILKLNDSSDSADFTLWCTLLAYAVRLSEELDDEELDAVLSIIQNAAENSGDLLQAASSFAVAHALIVKDPSQLSDVLNTVWGVVKPCLYEGNPEVISMTISFINNMLMSGFLDVETVGELLERLTALAFDDSGANEQMKCPAILACSRLVQPGDGVVTRLLNIVASGIDSDVKELQATCVEAVGLLSVVLPEGLGWSFYEQISGIVEEGIDLELVCLCLTSIASLIETSSDKLRIVEAASALMISIIEGRVACLNGLPLIELESSVSFFSKVCEVISALISCRCSISGGICEFLLAWMRRDSELDKSPAIEALSQAVLGNVVPVKVCEEIVIAVVGTIPLAKDAMTQDNIVHLLNVLVLKHSEVVNSVYGLMDSLMEWWKNAIGVKSGFQNLIGNLGALFVVLSIFISDFPDDLLIEVFQSFPLQDNDCTAPMLENTLTMLQRKRMVSPDLGRVIGVAIGKVLLCDPGQIEKMGIDSSLFDRLHGLLLELVKADCQIRAKIQALYSRSRVKLGRLRKLMGDC